MRNYVNKLNWIIDAALKELTVPIAMAYATTTAASSICSKFSLKNILLITVLSALTACSTGELIKTGVLATAYSGRSPSTEIQQTYYLGIFDPDEQLPPEVYRVRIHGQASALSGTKFASGWVKADMIDSLGSQISFAGDGDNLGDLTNSTEQSLMASLTLGRRQILFGPEGFMEAPRDHRLVVVMGSSPDAFFSAIDDTLGAISGADEELRQSELRKKILEALFLIRSENLQLSKLAQETEVKKE